MKTLPTLAVAAALTISGNAMSDVLVELYTSQGCSSCPPADVVLGALADDEDVLALAFHVDYWDRLGFPDTFGSPENTQRQYAYAGARNERSVFTPQALINGQHSFVGSNAGEITKSIAAEKGKTAYDDAIVEEGDAFTVTLTPRDIGRGDVVLMVAEYLPKQTVNITAGENGGRTLDYHNVVDDLRVLGKFANDEVISVSVPKIDGKGQAIFVQHDDPGAVLYAKNLQRP